MHFHEEEKTVKKESNRSDSEIGFTSSKQETKSYFDSTNNLSPGPMISKEREKAVLKIPCWPAPVTNLVISHNCAISLLV